MTCTFHISAPWQVTVKCIVYKVTRTQCARNGERQTYKNIVVRGLNYTYNLQ